MPVEIVDNITITECATFLTGPYAGLLLADLGARRISADGNWITARMSWLHSKTR